jgi:hypothetical protein
VRSASGAITTFSAGSLDTVAAGINAAGAVTGHTTDFQPPVFVYLGFVRTPDGTVTTFDVSGAGTGELEGTVPLGINAAGAETGYYIDAGGTWHGFARGTDGATASFDPPGSVQTVPASVNNLGPSPDIT